MSPRVPNENNNLARGALLVIASSLIFAAMGAAIKVVSVHLPLEMVVFFRNFFGLISLSPWILHAGPLGIRTQRCWLHGVRTLAGLAGMYCFFYALGRLHLGEAVLLNFSAPLFIPVFALLWLRESVPNRLPWALAVGLAGIALILKPTIGILNPIALIGLASGIFTALVTVCIRDLSKTEPPERIVFYFGAFATLGSAIPLLWNWQTPDLTQWGLLMGIGLMATMAQVLVTRGIAQAPAGQLGPFSYATVVFAAVIGWVAWGEMLDGISLVGAMLVCIAGVLVLRSESSSQGTQAG